MFDKTTKFLIVDDFLTMRNVVKKILSEQGYQNICLATDGVDAKNQLVKAAADNAPIQFIVSDWNMPNMNGLELLKFVRATPEISKTPFMMVTAESEQAQIIDAVKCGVNEYVVKPFNAVTFNEKLIKVYNKINAVKSAA